MIKVLIADDHQMVREGLKQLLEMSGEVQVVSQAQNGQECLDKIIGTKPDIVLLDINMPVMDGLTALHQIKKKNIKCKVILLTIHNDVDYVIRSNELGCEGYIVKDSDFATLEKGIITVYNGERYIQPSLIPYLNNALINRDKDNDKIKLLSKREMSVLKLMAMGMPNKDIAGELNISERTVKNHISSIFKKLETTDRTQAAVFAIKNNLIQVK